MSKEVIKKLNVINKYLNFQVSIGGVSNSMAREIKKFVKEAIDSIDEEKKETEAKL